MPVKWTGLPAELISVAPRLGDQRLPGGPAALLDPGPPDRLAEAGQRRRVGVEDDEQVAPRRAGAGVAGGGEAGVARRSGPGAPRGASVGDRLRRAVARSRCRRRSARRPRPAPAAARAASAPAPRGCSRRRSGRRASGAPTPEASGRRRAVSYPRCSALVVRVGARRRAGAAAAQVALLAVPALKWTIARSPATVLAVTQALRRALAPAPCRPVPPAGRGCFELTSRPLLPPRRVRTNFETGTSGTCRRCCGCGRGRCRCGRRGRSSPARAGRRPGRAVGCRRSAGRPGLSAACRAAA